MDTHFTITFVVEESGWVVAEIPEVQGAISQGKTIDEARANVLSALADLLDFRREQSLEREHDLVETYRGELISALQA